MSVRVVRLVLFLLAFAALSGTPPIALCLGTAEIEPIPAFITVVDDASYAPFAFLDQEGKPRGISVDIWKLWSVKTGIPVRFKLMEWEAALQSVQSGTADVVGGLFRTSEREALFDFTSSFFSITTSIFFHRSIHGLRGLADLQGFTIGVVKGDSAEETIRRAMPSAKLEAFAGSEDLVAAAVAGKVRVFVLDTHAGRFYLAKHASEGQFNETLTPVGDNLQYAAVRKGNRRLLDLVQKGFDRISPAEVKGIVDQWAGASLNARIPWKPILSVLTAVVVVLLLLFMWNLQLKKSIRAAEAGIRQRTEDLARSRQHYQEIFDATSDLILIHDAENGVILDVNQATVDLLGVSRDELIGKGVGVISGDSPQYSSEEARSRVQDAVAKGQVMFEWQIRRKSGELLWVEVGLRHSQVAGQSRVIAVVRDISERKRAEEDVRRSEERFRSLIRGTLDPLLVLGFDGNIRFANQAVFDLLRIPETTPLGEISPMNYLTPSSCEKMMKDLGQIQRERVRIVSEYEMLTSTGEMGSIEAIGHCVSWEGEDCDLVTLRDITQRKRAERALVAQNEVLVSLMTEGKLFIGDFRQAVAEITEAWGKSLDVERTSVWMYSDDYRILSCVDLYCRSSGCHHSGEELNCAEFPEYVRRHCDGKPILATDVRSDLATSGIPESYWAEHDIRSLMDVPIWMAQEVRGVLSFEATGQQRQWTSEEVRLANVIATMISLGYEISERKRAVEERERLQEQLIQAQKMESVGRLAGGVAHDFNNMLSAILGYAEIGLERVSQPHPLHEILVEIKKAGTRSADLTRQLLAFARKQTVVPKILDLNATIEGMLGMLRRLIGENIALEWVPGTNLGRVKIDPSQIDQVLANLCVNARDAISGVGRIVIETVDTTLDGDSPGRYVRLSISDTGCGMSRETIGKIFEPFFTTKEVGQGTGLGLATVYGIVTQNRGQISVNSELGAGTTFHLFFPRLVDTSVDGAVRDDAPVAQSGTETILMVEDEPAILTMGKMMLEGLGYRVLTASSPAEAIRRAEEFPGTIDLLMTDVIMPEMNGKELATRLLARFPGLRGLFMSGYTANVIAEQGILEDHVQFLQKPFTMAELSQKVRQALGAEIPG